MAFKRIAGGWKSTETGATYLLPFENGSTDTRIAPNSMGAMIALDGFRKADQKLRLEQQIEERDELVAQTKKELQAELDKQKADAEKQRKTWLEQEQMSRAEFAKQQAAEAKKLEDQKVKFETDRVAREKAKVEAETKKQAELGSQRRLSGSTMLGNLLRKSGVLEDGIVADEDKRQLTEEDKQELFGTQEQQKRKAKETFLDRILNKGSTQTPSKQ